MIHSSEAKAYSAQQVADMLGMSKSFVLRKIKDKINPLPAYQIGSTYRVFVEDIAAYFHIPLNKLNKGE